MIFKNFNSERVKDFIPTKYHLLFWAGYFLINFVRWGSYFNDYLYSLRSNLVEFSIHIPLAYFHIYYLIPNYILKKKYTLYFFYVLLSLTLVYVARTGLNLLLVSSNIWPEAVGAQKVFSFNHIVAVTIGEIYVVALVTSIKLTVDWIVERKKNDSLKQLQLQTELNYLKSQIQPHFFFNTLNTLYYLTIQKSEKAADVVLKLSEIMQYVLYDVKEPRIPLLNEINYIQSYLELERTRYGYEVDCQVSIKGNIDQIQLPPLLLLPFIENCFKHGFFKSKNVNLDISFENHNNKHLIFKTSNSFNINQPKKKTGGIGLENVRRRLQLLYKNKFLLKTDVENNIYHVFLKIPIV